MVSNDSWKWQTEGTPMSDEKGFVIIKRMIDVSSIFPSRKYLLDLWNGGLFVKLNCKTYVIEKQEEKFTIGLFQIFK